METPSNDRDWRRYPQMESLAEEESYRSMMKKVEATCRELDQTLQTGAPQEQQRAKAALAAYGITLQLIREIQERIEQQAGAAR